MHAPSTQSELISQGGVPAQPAGLVATVDRAARSAAAEIQGSQDLEGARMDADDNTNRPIVVRIARADLGRLGGASRASGNIFVFKVSKTH